MNTVFTRPFLVWAVIGVFTVAYADKRNAEGNRVFNICTPKVVAAGQPCATAPKAIYTPDPEYSEPARKAGYEGLSVLWVLVGADGQVENVRVARKAGRGLDEQAVKAVRLWKFEPGEYQGNPVRVQVNVEVNFRLHR